jgi:hypothetical protein
MGDIFHRVDQQVSVVSEEFARKLSRRQVLLHTAKGMVAGMAAISVGSLTGFKNAFAATSISGPGCCYINPGHPCSKTGTDCLGHGFGTCPNAGCPSGCTVCYSSQCSECGWTSSTNGCWVGYSGYCNCGFGYKTCCDCKCTGCSRSCTCLSQVICCGCCSEADVRASIAAERAEGYTFDSTVLLG